MSWFKRMFGYEKKENKDRRTLANLDRGLESGYMLYLTMANTYYTNGDLESAFRHLNKAIELCDISDWQLYAFKAKIYEDQKNYTDAISNYSKAIELASDELNVYALYHQIGYCYLFLGNNQKAEDFYTTAIDIKKKHPNEEYFPDREGIDGGILRGLPFERLYNNRGNARKNLGKLKEALDDCNSASLYNDSYSNPFLLAGQILLLANNYEGAITLYRRSAELGNEDAKRFLKSQGY